MRQLRPMAADTIENIALFLRQQFLPGAATQAFDADMYHYAQLAHFLSQPSPERLAALVKISEMLQMAYAEFAWPPDPPIPLQQPGERIVGAFSRALVFVAHRCFGFNEHVLVLNGQLQSEADFATVVRTRCLFRDIYTTTHGEYTHALQWLLLAQAARDGRFGPNCNVPYLYAKSVDYQCRYDLEGLFGGKRSLWHLLVDCFSIGGTEDYTRNLYSNSWRCPQVITMTIGKVIPDGTWLGAYVANRAHRKRTKPGGRLEKPSDHFKAKDHEVNRYLQMHTGPMGQQIPVGNVYVKNPAALRKKPG